MAGKATGKVGTSYYAVKSPDIEFDDSEDSNEKRGYKETTVKRKKAC